MDIRLVKQPAVVGNVQVSIENFIYFCSNTSNDVYMNNYTHYIVLFTLRVYKDTYNKETLRIYFFFCVCVKRKTKLDETKLKIRRIPEINIS